MFGLDTYFNCPECGYNKIINLGVTYFVEHKSENLALHNCPKCNKKIAFKVIDNLSDKLGNSKLNIEGKIMKEKVINIISSNIHILNYQEDKIIKFILNKLKEEYTEGYLDKYAYEVYVIIEYILANNLYTKSYNYEKIKKECKDAYCICF